MVPKMKIKGLTLRRMVKSQGFLIPVQYLDDRMTDGLTVGKKYDIELRESKQQEEKHE